MALETDLKALGRYLVDELERARLEILVDQLGESPLPAFNAVIYGEPRVITQWPLLSVQPQNKLRTLKGTRKFDLQFFIWLVLYHGRVADTLSIQEGTHSRIEAVELFLMRSQKLNYVDTTDTTKDKVIFGYPTFIDHPVVLAPDNELWSASRIELQATSEEVF